MANIEKLQNPLKITEIADKINEITDVQVNIDNVVTELNGKAGVDLANVNDAGKAVMANMAMPSNNYTELSYANGTTYTAPADGYFAVVASTSNGGGVRLENTSLGIVTTSIAYTKWSLGTYIAVRKGDKVYADGWQATVSALRFYYTEGSKP